VNHPVVSVGVVVIHGDVPMTTGHRSGALLIGHCLPCKVRSQVRIPGRRVSPHVGTDASSSFLLLILRCAVSTDGVIWNDEWGRPCIYSGICLETLCKTTRSTRI